MPPHPAGLPAGQGPQHHRGGRRGCRRLSGGPGDRAAHRPGNPGDGPGARAAGRYTHRLRPHPGQPPGRGGRGPAGGRPARAHGGHRRRRGPAGALGHGPGRNAAPRPGPDPPGKHSRILAPLSARQPAAPEGKLGMARTKIIATLGPATDKVDVLVEMIKAGMDVARVNLSHVTPETLTAYIEKVREAARLAQRPTLAVMLDTRGPEIRVGNLPYGGIKLTEGQLVHLVPGDGEFSPGEPWLAGGPGNPRVAVIPVTYGKLAEVVEPGQRILLDDGNFALDVEHVEAPRVVARVLVGGHLKARKRVTLPHQPGDLPVLTEADTEDLRLGLSLGADLVAASFIRDAADVLTVRRLIETMGSSAGVVAKVENRQAVEQLDEILSVADGIMVARGDLGVELTAEEVPVLQKDIIRRCNRAGKPVIIATQMLESMVSRPRPTRAEASDVANAI